MLQPPTPSRRRVLRSPAWKSVAAAAPWFAALAAACQGGPAPAPGTFSDDLAFLCQHADTIVLTSPTGARVALVPAFQGRVMTSTTGGGRDDSFGWLHRERIAAGTFVDHINAFGGEDRFWIGPEGGQFSVFFAPDSKFELAAWQTPAPLDREPFDLVEQSARHAVFTRKFTLQNRAGTRFDIAVRREVRLREPWEVLARLGVPWDLALRAVSFETVNTLTNAGDAAWTKERGLLSIWILGMFPASPTSRVLIPFVGGPERYHGSIVTDDYFGAVPADRLQVDTEKSLITFRGDGAHRSKIGVGPRRAKPVLGSWDESRGVLTLVEFTLPVEARDYVDSRWRLQDAPFAGDVVNSYNDGPPEPGGKGLGSFYELESSSPALALAPGGAATHVHRTTHLVGPRRALAAIARQVLGADLGPPPASR